MRLIPVFIFASLLLYGATITGCKYCLCCVPMYANYSCIKGTDTIAIQSYPGNEVNYSDSLKLYRNEGFVCVGSAIPYLSLNYEPTCGRSAIEAKQASGLDCVNPPNGPNGDCDR